LFKPIPNSDSVSIEFQPNTRSPLTISLASQSTSKNYSSNISLISGARLTYDSTSPTTSIGSGGPEAFLKGQIVFEENNIIEVDCTIQQEWKKPDATWCVPYLHHLKIHSDN